MNLELLRTIGSTIIHVDDEEDLAAQFGVMSIPCLVAMKGGEVVTKKVGVQPKEGILAMLG